MLTLQFNLTAARVYLERVYPHDEPPVDPALVNDALASLDFVYTSAPASSSVCLPFRLHGYFYMAPARLSSLATGAFPTRHAQHGALLDGALHCSSSASGLTGRHGPQPSWTPHTALIRYIFWPAGLCPSSLRKGWRTFDVCTTFDLRRNAKVSALFGLRHGDRVEVTQHGGWLGPGRESGNGFWATVWRGTGVFLRVASPFVSLSKTGALLDMLHALEQRNASGACEEVAAVLGVVHMHFVNDTLSERTRSPAATAAQALGAHILLRCPCMHTAWWRQTGRGPLSQRPKGFAGLMSRWLSFLRTLSAADAIEAFRALTYPSQRLPFNSAERFAIYWVYSFCGSGDVSAGGSATPIGMDKLLGLLACMLGHSTVLLAANPNDNGLLAQELVDFEYVVQARAPRDGAPGAAQDTSHPLPPLLQATTGLERCMVAWRGEAAWAHRSPTAAELRSWHQHVWSMATRNGKFAASASGKPCGARYGNLSPSSAPGSVKACADAWQAKACYLWCDCSAIFPGIDGVKRGNASSGCRVPAAASAALRHVSLLPPSHELRAMRHRGQHGSISAQAAHSSAIETSSQTRSSMDGALDKALGTVLVRARDQSQREDTWRFACEIERARAVTYLSEQSRRTLHPANLSRPLDDPAASKPGGLDRLITRLTRDPRALEELSSTLEALLMVRQTLCSPQAPCTVRPSPQVSPHVRPQTQFEVCLGALPPERGASVLCEVSPVVDSPSRSATEIDSPSRSASLAAGGEGAAPEPTRGFRFKLRKACARGTAERCHRFDASAIYAWVKAVREDARRTPTRTRPRGNGPMHIPAATRCAVVMSGHTLRCGREWASLIDSPFYDAVFRANARLGGAAGQRTSFSMENGATMADATERDAACPLRRPARCLPGGSQRTHPLYRGKARAQALAQLLNRSGLGLGHSGGSVMGLATAFCERVDVFGMGLFSIAPGQDVIYQHWDDPSFTTSCREHACWRGEDEVQFAARLAANARPKDAKQHVLDAAFFRTHSHRVCRPTDECSSTYAALGARLGEKPLGASERHDDFFFLSELRLYVLHAMGVINWVWY